MGANLDMECIAKTLGAERRGKVSAGGGYFGALQLAAEIPERFRVPEGGGRATDPSWSEQRLVRLSPRTLEQLEKLAKQAHASPMQVAALLLEGAVQAVANQEPASRMKKGTHPFIKGVRPLCCLSAGDFHFQNTNDRPGSGKAGKSFSELQQRLLTSCASVEPRPPGGRAVHVSRLLAPAMLVQLEADAVLPPRKRQHSQYRFIARPQGV